MKQRTFCKLVVASCLVLSGVPAYLPPHVVQRPPKGTLCQRKLPAVGGE